MSRIPNLLKRSNGVYYFRFYVPSDLIDRFERRELTFSLGTGDRLDAEKISTILRVLFFELTTYLKHFQPMHYTPEDLQAMARRFFERALAAAKEKRFSTVLRSTLDDGPSASEFLADQYSENVSRLTSELKRNDFSSVKEAVQEVVEYEDVTIEDGDDYNHLAHHTLRAVIELQNTIYEWQKGGGNHLTARVSPVSSVESSSESPHVAAQDDDAVAATDATIMSFSELVENFHTHHERVWKPKTKHKYTACLKFALDIVGDDRAASAISKADVRKVRDTLVKLPRNWRTTYSGLSALEASERAAADGKEPMTPAAVNAYLGALSSLFAWAVKEGHVDANPAAKIKVPQRVSAAEQRNPFDADQLVTVFSAPIFTGMRSAHFWKEPGSRVIENERYWVPLIALYSGMRLSEIFGLTKSDFGSDGDVPFFNIREAKTAAGVRRLPIHPSLIEIGLLTFVDGLNDGASMFAGSHAPKFSKFFARFLDSVGLQDHKLVFHSFRHTFTDALRRARVEEPVLRALIGHSDGSVTGRYGSGYDLAALSEAISRVEYERILDAINSPVQSEEARHAL